MSQEVPFRLPINLILLDGVGAVLLALGLAEYFGDLNVLPTALSFEYRAYVLMAAGVVLMLPLVLYILNWTRSRSEGSVLK